MRAEEGLAEAAIHGYSHWYIDGSLVGERPADWTEARISAMCKSIEDAGIKPIYHGNFKAPLGSDVPEMALAAVNYVKREIDLCAQLGGIPLIVHGGGIVEPRLVKEARSIGLENLIRNLNELVAYGRERNVDIWLENLCNYNKFHPFYYIYTTEDEYAKVLEQVPGIYFFLDVSHAHVNDGAPIQVFERFHHRIAGMSFSDNAGDRDSHMPLGRGNLDYPQLLQAIRKVSWQGIIGFETRGSTLSHSAQYLKTMDDAQAQNSETLQAA
ncbi:sugar phosphate isomerase/epimerase family protein [Paraherbaspirillum soli]|uniref:Sugar phosphate isomerase/epimerase family protein n=1 Tax=Paraherbaspirillum soli TaxID=631222 RepID=A0ABW0M6Z6_9BURK